MSRPDLLRLSPAFLGDESSEVERWKRAQSKIAAALDWPWPSLALDVARSAEPTTAILSLQDWFDSEQHHERPIAVVSGGYGVGKTVSLAWIGFHRLAREQPRFITAQQLARMPRDERFEFIDEMFTHDTKWSNALLLDDIGAERADARSTWIADFDEIVDVFYRTEATLVLSTNLSPKEFELRYGARVCDRLAERGKWFDVAGDSMRGKPTPAADLSRSTPPLTAIAVDR